MFGGCRSSFGIAFDIDGVILRGRVPIGGSPRALRRMYRDSGTTLFNSIYRVWNGPGNNLHLISRKLWIIIIIFWFSLSSSKPNVGIRVDLSGGFCIFGSQSNRIDFLWNQMESVGH